MSKYIFITREGIQNPGARVRSYGFSGLLKEKGLNVKVFSFVDDLGAKAGKSEGNFSFGSKLNYMRKGLGSLLKEDKNSTFIVNRFNYHAISPWFTSKIKNIPYVFDMDDWEAREDTGKRLGFLPKSKAIILTKRFAKESRFCIAASAYLRKYLFQFNKRVFYLPTGVDTQKFKPKESKDKKDIVFSWHGSINRPEIVGYIGFIIDCFSAIKKDHPCIKLFIAGDGIFKKDLIELLKNSNCPGIEYREWIHHENIPDYLAKADIGLAPLLDGSHFNLSKSPVKLFEYMACGLPSVASAIGEAEIIIEDGKDGFLAKTKEEYIEKMRKLVEDPDLRIDLGKKAREKVIRDYSLDTVGNKLHKIIQNN